MPTLPSTTEDATEAPSGAISIQMGAGTPVFAPNQVTAKAGKVAFFLENVRGPVLPVDHSMAIGPKLYAVLARSAFIRADQAAVFTVDDLTPATYTFWCEVGTHAADGMVGTLTITP